MAWREKEGALPCRALSLRILAVCICLVMEHHP